jgi:hypothetical protein
MKNLNHLSVEDVQRNLRIQQQIVQEQHPDVAVDRGLFHDVILYYSAAFATDNQKYVQDAMKALNIGRLLREPDKVSKEVVDRVASNWLVKRKDGKYARGLVTVVLDARIPLHIPAGWTITAHGIVYKAEQGFTVRVSDGATMQPNDRLLTRLGTSQFAFTIPVVATTPGTAANLRKGTHLQLNGREVGTSIRKVFAATDFSAGADEETNAQVLRRLSSGANASTWSNRLTAEAVISGMDKFDRLAGLSVIGFGDPEMQRDRHSLWPGSTGGRTDVYVRPLQGILTKDVNLVGKAVKKDDGYVWAIYVDKDAAPGFYYPVDVRRIDGGQCSIVSDTRGYDTAGAPVDIKNALEATYSPYQTAVLEVREEDAPTVADITAIFVVSFRYIAGLDVLQTKLLDREIASAGADVLVKAPIPCFTSVLIELDRNADDLAFDVQGLREAVANEVNNYGLGGKLLTTAAISAVTIRYLRASSNVTVRRVLLKANLRWPGGKTEQFEDGVVLRLPHAPDQMVTSRTVAFFQEPANVQVVINTVDY